MMLAPLLEPAPDAPPFGRWRTLLDDLARVPELLCTHDGQLLRWRLSLDVVLDLVGLVDYDEFSLKPGDFSRSTAAN